MLDPSLTCYFSSPLPCWPACSSLPPPSPCPSTLQLFLEGGTTTETLAGLVFVVVVVVVVGFQEGGTITETLASFVFGVVVVVVFVVVVGHYNGDEG